MEGGGERGVDFPEALLERVFARIPFPEVVNVRRLSKQWRANFSRITREVSTKWPKYLPVVEHSRKLFGYDSVADCWKCLGKDLAIHMRFPSMPICIPPHHFAGCGVLFVQLYIAGGYLKAVVINTRTRKETYLCICEEGNLFQYPMRAVVNSVGANRYELVVCQKPGTGWRVHVYRSISRTWIRRDFQMEARFQPLHNFFRDGAFMDGSMCFALREKFDAHFVSFNLNSGAVTTIPLSAHNGPLGPHHGNIVIQCAVVRCGSRILLLIFEVDTRGELFARVLQFDSDNYKLIELSNTAMTPENVSRDEIEIAASSEFIWVSDRFKRLFLTFHVETKSWKSCINPCDALYEGTHSMRDDERNFGSFVLDVGVQDPFVEP